jgi:DUF2934 family protein
MPNKRKSPDKQQPIELTTDFPGEDRHESVAKLAYKLWEQRGRPFGLPEGFAAERSCVLVAGSVRFGYPLSECPAADSRTNSLTMLEWGCVQL